MERGRVVKSSVVNAGHLPSKVKGDDYLDELHNDKDRYLEALREIDIHIRSTDDPVRYIIETLKTVLPEYKTK